MGFLEDVTKGGWTTALVGVGVALLAPSVLPAVGAALRPLTKALVKGGVMAYDAAKESLAEAGEQVNDLIAEARAEIEEGTAGTGGTMTAETSRKEREPERKPTGARKEP
jgi:hypothetical protein